MELFRLFGSILIDDQKAIETLRKTENKAGGLSKILGGVGIAAVAAGTALATGLGAALVTGAKDAMEAEEKVAQLEAVLKSTKGAAGLTSAELLKMAEGFEQTTKFSAESVIEAQSLLLTFTKVGSEVFPRATQAAADMATAMGTDMAGQSMALGKALNDPIAGVAALTRVGVQFTDEQKNSIKAMVEMGDIAGAQGVILGELETQFGGSAEAAGKTMAGQLEILKNAFGGVKEELALQFMPVLANFMDWIMLNMPQIKEFMSTAFETIGNAVSRVWDIFQNYFLPVIQNIFNWTVENWPTISAIFQGVFDAIKLVWEEILSPVLGALWEGIKKVVDFVSEHFPRMQETARKVFENIGNAVQTVVDVFVKVRDVIKDAWEWLGKWQERDAQSSFNTYGQDSYGGSYGAGVNGTGGTIGGALPAMQARNERRNENSGSMNVNINVRSPYDVVKELRVLDKGLASEVR